MGLEGDENVRRTVAQLLRTLDGWLPVRRLTMTWTVAAACAGYMAVIALQLTLVAPPYAGAAAAAPTYHRGLVSISKAEGVCLLPVCLLAPTCVAGVGGTCLLPLATPAPVQPAPRAPIGASAAPAAPKHAAPAAPAPAAPAAGHVAAAPAAPGPAAPPSTIVVTRIDRSVAVAAPPVEAPPVTGVPLPPIEPATQPAAPAPSPAGSPWWLYVLFVAVDGAAAVALVILVRRTAAAQSRR